MELTFEFTDGMKFKTGKFVLDNPEIMGTGTDMEVEYDDIELYLDGDLYTGGINTWRENNLSADALFENVLSSYLRHNTSEYKNFGEGWSIFSEITDLEEWDGDLLIKLPVYDLGVKVYELDLATPELRYYSYDDEFLLLDTAGRVVTDMEEFYAESMEEDLYNILKGTTACLYMGYNPQAMIDEYGGEDAFVEEFADVYGV